ncbi:hypothetical protein vBOeSunk162_41 [Oenococcus phage vB_OeS_unk162]|nr:hypothetical protein vBOeSunk162_41 [Oenococcus phage vB_OeS_unk162]QNO11554.1 hypothetical protein [Oenococcus phage Vinitor-27]
MLTLIGFMVLTAIIATIVLLERLRRDPNNKKASIIEGIKLFFDGKDYDEELEDKALKIYQMETKENEK